MADELVDIVDDRNQVTGQMMKTEAHRLGALHRCVVSHVIDSEGNWILVKQADDRQDAGQFVSPVGGHVGAGESDDEALKREAMEELGITAVNFKRLGRAVFNREVIGRKENHLFSLYEIYTDEQPTLNHESVGVEKFTLPQIKQELKDTPKKFGDAFHYVIRHFYPELL
ncbi:MAG: NUDIX hydrolase [Candidatus Woesebacteria bacterium]